jgi:hypothetical protein
MNARIPSIVPASRLDVIARGSKLGAARELIRSAQIHDDRELYQHLNNILSACSFKSQYTAQLLDLCTDLDGEMHYPPEPEVLGWDKRGELDGYTQRSVR